MTAKNILRVALFVALTAIAVPASSSSIVPGSSETNSPAKTENPRAQQLVQRLEEIKGMDKSELTRTEKKSLRKEVKGIKKEMKSSGGVYLSIGAVIIIILLLILIL
jgi:predicted PurR-regulated permease PerM